MKKILMGIFMLLLTAMVSFAEYYPMYGYCQQVGNNPPIPFSGVEYLNIPENGDELYEFKGFKWDLDVDTDLGNNLDLFLSEDFPSGKMVIDTRNDELIIELYVTSYLGTVCYTYTEEQRNFAASSSGQYGSYDDENSYSKGSSNYQAMYDKWERQAQRAYESLSGHSVSSSTYISNKRLLRDAQQEMRSIRSKARSNGVYITQSRWETVSVRLD